MGDLFKLVVDSIMDAIEEFFNALIIPNVNFTKDAFIVSLVFLGWSILAKVLKLPSLVNWQEALTCSIILTFIVLIDNNTRSIVVDNIKKVKTVTNMFMYTGEQEEEIIKDEN